MRKNKWLEALQYLTKLIENYPDSMYASDTYFKICQCYENLRDSNLEPKEKINPLIEESYKNLLTKYPEHPHYTEVLIKLGWLAFNQGRLQESVTHFETGLEKFPSGTKPADVLYAVGSIYEKTGEIEKAVKAYQEILKTLPDYDPKAQNIQEKLLQLSRN